MSSNDEDDDNHEKKTGAEKILEMLKEAGVSTESLEEKKHAFWDTQVGTVHHLSQPHTAHFVSSFFLVVAAWTVDGYFHFVSLPNNSHFYWCIVL